MSYISYQYLQNLIWNCYCKKQWTKPTAYEIAYLQTLEAIRDNIN
jgi:hypothetical protein